MAIPIQGSEFEVVIDTEVDNTGALNAAIDWVAPDCTSGQWPATVDLNLLRYTTAIADIHVSGTWVLQSYVETVGGLHCHGEPVKMSVGKLIRGAEDTHP